MPTDKNRTRINFQPKRHYASNREQKRDCYKKENPDIPDTGRKIAINGLITTDKQLQVTCLSPA
ncbi:MAG: hypothetical protein A2X03_13020 [Bacteroidetes bacterium GWA2_40_15]|nr:MAG: hypothetical protein A2X03_13020 [Bacteroidetes bacterium GWA2_40_15]HCU21284.1 hypothetical protein [Bacteroidales bacterium]